MATEIQKPKDSELEGELTKKTLDIDSEKPADDESLVKEDEPKSSESLDTALPSSTVDSSSTASDLEKKMRRAERFGMPVQLSEKEKRNSRAERFGTASTTPESDELKKSEDLKRKARAERFGLPAKSVADEEAKKKARQARFGPDSKKDSVEEDKMKARAIRFSKTPAEARSEINGKDSSVQEPATGNKVNGDT